MSTLKKCASRLSSQACGVVIKAGLLACDHRFPHLPKALLQWHFADCSHLQWRDRAGIEPASLLTHVLRHKHLYDFYKIIVPLTLYNKMLRCRLHFFRSVDSDSFQRICKCRFHCSD